MTATHHDFDLCLEKRAPHEFTAYVPDEAGGRAVEHHFGLRLDTLKMREHLRRLEAYALHGELVRDDFHAWTPSCAPCLLARKEVGDEVVYPMHALVRDYARRRRVESAEDERVLLLRAARFWELQADQTKYLDEDVFFRLRAREYYYRAGEYEKADDIVTTATEPMMRWGLRERLIQLLNESIKTLEEPNKAVAMGNLATVYYMTGDYQMAIKIYEQVKALFEEQGHKLHAAIVLHQIGMIHQDQGNYAEAQARYEQSLATFTELGAKREVAASLSQLGIIHQLQGDYQEAQQKQEQSLAIRMEIGDKQGIAICLHQLGRIHQHQGNYGEAQARYEQSLVLLAELGAKLEMASVLHNLGIIHQHQGNYGEAQARYEQNLAIATELGDKRGIASSLHQLGRIHEEQGSYVEAQARYEQSLAINDGTGR